MDSLELWRRYRKYLCECPGVGMKLDISRVDFPNKYFSEHEERMQEAYKIMRGLEAGDIANPDDDREFEGPGTMTIGEPIVMNEEPFFRGTPYVITATLDVDGQPLEVSVVDTIDLVCN